MILCVDDEPNVLAALRRLLHPFPFEVVTVTSGKGAIGIAEKRTPDLVILDRFMPGMDGYETLHRLRELGLTDTPVVILSGDTDILRGYDEGAVYYIHKPFRGEHVAHIVEYHLGDPSPERRAWLELHF